MESGSNADRCCTGLQIFTPVWQTVVLGLRFDLKTDIFFLYGFFQFKLYMFCENAYFCKYCVFLPPEVSSKVLKYFLRSYSDGKSLAQDWYC